MVFLIEYDRRRGKLVSFQTFKDSERDEAHDARLDLELRLFRSEIEHEVVILEAESEELIRRTHARYFYSLRELVEQFKAALQAAQRPNVYRTTFTSRPVHATRVTLRHSCRE